MNLFIIRRLFSAIFIWLLLLSSNVFASDKFELDTYSLPNGMKVIHDKSPSSTCCAIRLIVNVGALDFPEEKRELPHILEHLLFDGTSKYSASDFSKRMDKFGSELSAETKGYFTIYEINAESDVASKEIELLYDMITAPLMSEKSFELEKKLVVREAVEKYNYYPGNLLQLGFGWSAAKQAVEHTLQRSYANEINGVSGISRSEVVAVYRKFHVPENMTIIVSGEFEEISLDIVLAQTFGRMSKSKDTTPWEPHNDIPIRLDGPKEFTGQLNFTLENNSSVDLIYNFNSFGGDDFPVLLVLGAYMNYVIFETMAINSGVAYSPGGGVYFSLERGFAGFSVEVDIDEMSHALSVMREEIKKLKDGQIDREYFNLSKRGAFGSYASEVTYSSLANYLVEHFSEYERNGSYVDHRSAIKKVTFQDIQNVVQKYFVPKREIVILNQPTMTYGEFLLVSFILIATLLLLVAVLIKRK